MNYFDSDMSKNTNTVVCFDWNTIIYIYVCGQCRTQFMLPNSSRRQFINMYIYDGKVSHMHRRMWQWDYTQSIKCTDCFRLMLTQHLMKGKFKQWWSPIPPISTKRTIASRLNWTHWTQKDIDMWGLEIQVLGWDRHKIVARLNRLI